MEALAAVARDLPWPVEVAGDAPAPGLVRGVAPGGALRHLGRLTPARLHGLMAGSEIFAAPARYEPFGLAVLEAALMGCALVLGNVPTLVELWGDAARFVAPDDPDALRGTLMDLIGDPAARRRLQAAARRRARAYSRRMMTVGYLEAYAGLRAPATGPARGRVPPAWMIAATASAGVTA
jgi:glycosyltransferase involved in cell wall biosynthesis